MSMEDDFWESPIFLEPLPPAGREYRLKQALQELNNMKQRVEGGDFLLCEFK